MGWDWGGKLISFIVIKSAKEKSRENHRQTNKQTKKVEEKAGYNFKEKKESSKKKKRARNLPHGAPYL